MGSTRHPPIPQPNPGDALRGGEPMSDVRLADEVLGDADRGNGGQTPTPQRPQGGSSRRTTIPISSSGQVPLIGSPGLPDDLTIISQRPPLPGAASARATLPSELGQMLTGQRLDHFELLEFVGGGGMGAVFRARDTMLNREVAVKVLPRDQGAEEETRRRFQNEAQSAARLDHDNIARVFYVGVDRGLNYIVFEFIRGLNIREVVEQRGPLPLAEAVSYCLQIAEALAHASSRDVVHRDIKPSNVLITSDGRAKLVDMGLARLHQVEPGDDLTASGVTLGTFDYISPEQARDPRSADVRSDIYSLGCTLYYMLTGRPPFPEGTVLQKLLQHNSDEPPDAREFNPDLPEEVSALLHKMLAKDPRKRYQSAGELISELLLMADRLGLRTAGGNAVVWVARTPAKISFIERHLPWMAPVAALLCIVIVLDFTWTGRLHNAPEPQEKPDAAKGGSGTPPTRSVAQRPSAEKTSNEGNTAPTPGSKSGKKNQKNPGTNQTVGPNSPRTKKSDGNSTTNDPVVTKTPVTDDGGNSSSIGPIAQLSASASLASVDAVGSSEANSPSAAFGLTGGDKDAAALSLVTRDEPGRRPVATTSQTPAPASAGNNMANITPRPGLLIVTPSPQGVQQYANLRAACSEAKNGDVIELRYNGRREEKPFVLNNLKITLRAAEGFRPVISFLPAEIDPVKYSRSMITVAGGQLNLVNVALELDVPNLYEVPADYWSLIETQRTELLSLEKCSMTIRNSTDARNASHTNVAFLSVRAAPGRDAMMIMNEDAPQQEPVTIRLQHCVARGEANFLRSDELQPLSLEWDNGLLTTTERVFTSQGVQAAPRHPGKVQISLRHVTAAVRGGMARLACGMDAPYLLDTTFHCTDSIFLGSSQSAWIEQQGGDAASDVQNKLDWNGDRNFYEGVNANAFWKIHSSGGSEPPQLLPLADRRSRWGQQQEILPTWNQVEWKQLPSPDRPVHLLVVDDYALNDRSATNAALHGASDGEDVGLETRFMPVLPLPPIEPR
jgi:serine/threonine protein kinase